MTPTTLERRALARILRFLRATAPRRPRRVLLEEAEIELWGLYRREQAQLLGEAGRLRATASTAASTARVLLAEGARRERRRALRAWRARARECAALCAHDGYPLAPSLAACTARPLHAWPTACALRTDASRLGARID